MIRILPLRDRAGTTVAMTMVDDDVWEWARHYRWHLGKGGYASRSDYRRGDGKAYRRPGILLHREVLGLATHDPRLGDHKNGSRLDNRRSNLRIVERGVGHVQNRRTWGRSTFRGVSWHKGTQQWRAQAQLNGVKHHLGYFTTEEQAALAAARFREAHMPFAITGR